MTKSHAFNLGLRRVEESLHVPVAGAPELRLVFHADVPEAERRARADGRRVKFLGLQVDPLDVTGWRLSRRCRRLGIGRAGAVPAYFVASPLIITEKKGSGGGGGGGGGRSGQPHWCPSSWAATRSHTRFA